MELKVYLKIVLKWIKMELFLIVGPNICVLMCCIFLTYRKDVVRCLLERFLVNVLKMRSFHSWKNVVRFTTFV